MHVYVDNFSETMELKMVMSISVIRKCLSVFTNYSFWWLMLLDPREYGLWMMIIALFCHLCVVFIYIYIYDVENEDFLFKLSNIEVTLNYDVGEMKGTPTVPTPPFNLLIYLFLSWNLQGSQRKPCHCVINIIYKKRATPKIVSQHNPISQEERKGKAR